MQHVLQEEIFLLLLWHTKSSFVFVVGLERLKLHILSA